MVQTSRRVRPWVQNQTEGPGATKGQGGWRENTALSSPPSTGEGARDEDDGGGEISSREPQVYWCL